jgi:hypothetical protein
MHFLATSTVRVVFVLVSNLVDSNPWTLVSY